MQFIVNKSKNKKWYNRNYFYVGTILVIVLNIMLFACLGYDFANDIGGDYIWNGVFDISNILRSFVNVFVHINWQHVLLNMLCFAICGIYLERKLGTLNFILFILGFSFFAGCVTTAARNTVNHCGASGLIYMCYAFIILDYIFTVITGKEKNKTNIVLGSIIILCIYIAMAFDSSGNSLIFKFYPYDLIYNAAHYSSFFAGIVITLIIKVCHYNRNVIQ